MVEIVLNSAGIIELLQGEAMQSEINGHAARIVNSLGEGFEASSYIGFDRAHAVVKAVSEEAKKACYEDNVLLKAIGQ